jgi:hypothetical protein
MAEINEDYRKWFLSTYVIEGQSFDFGHLYTDELNYIVRLITTELVVIKLIILFKQERIDEVVRDYEILGTDTPPFQESDLYKYEMQSIEDFRKECMRLLYIA